ncbi:serine/threonine-protein phosphatase 7 long form-like protein [Gossypium australe]|uniref:Serine/threonine-protein phosphatase 7 long form-like protein n=1 Tax=Gossypium australe TaxID=47621 RepID=A0A5B6VPQ9_9ROSI|nr:serine/threonine-protein phosphatase 7 long form-like protein [Gossypium australe]
MALIGWGCKLDLAIVSALVERWRLEMHTLHLLCGECTITLKDVQLQLGLPVDGSVVNGSVHAID